MILDKLIPDHLLNKYEFHNYHHAAEVISCAFPNEWRDLLDMLSAFMITKTDLSTAGGAETSIPGKVDSVLYPRKWRNVQVSGELNVKFYERIIDRKQYSDFPVKESTISGYLNGQQIDFYKSRIGIYLEWNKKDLAFDKVLNDIKSLYDANIISAAAIMTRGEDLNDAFKRIMDDDGKPVFRKYGSSSTWLGRLLPRLEARQAGGCPVLAIGIKKHA